MYKKMRKLRRILATALQTIKKDEVEKLGEQRGHHPGKYNLIKNRLFKQIQKRKNLEKVQLFSSL